MPRAGILVNINLWTARLIPIFLAVGVGYATYVLVALLSVNHLLTKDHAQWSAISILVSYFILFILMITSFFRLTFITYFEPPYVPLGLGHHNDMQDNTGIGAYCNDKDVMDSPGLELFYTKDMFIADSTGKPRWCSPCGNWKPDRTHHCLSSGRCIRKMDHFCPWVGGPVGENNFKFFIQFTSYSALYCTHLFVVLTTYVFGIQRSKGEDFEYHFMIVIAMTAFFLLFTGSMALNSIQLATSNLTQVERLGLRKKNHFLAVLVPPWQDPNNINLPAGSTHNYPLIIYSSRSSDKHLQYSGQYRYRLNSSKNNSDSNLESINLEKISTSILTSSKSEEKLLSKIESNEPLNRQRTVKNWKKNKSETQKKSALPKEIDTKDLKRYESGFRGDVKAFRTFVIVQTNEGENLWDLGTRLKNWRTVMGEDILEWALPVRRSPCCNHENPESQFQLGPLANQIRLRLGFLAPPQDHDIQGK
ncbi:hypothetical protein K3495_g6730 [Podosphaera aphanis]|nr:hypothetical protein K3495_g6730 [Podosphaera aphanis]